MTTPKLLLLVLAVCAAPLIFSYIAYYVIKPSARNNFGALIDPREHPIPALQATTLDAKPASPPAFQGKWTRPHGGSGSPHKSPTASHGSASAGG